MGIFSLLFSFNGRINRMQWWVVTILSNIIIAIITTIISNYYFHNDYSPYNYSDYNIAKLVCSMFVLCVVLYIQLCINIKRFHDRNKDGAIPVSNVIVIVILSLLLVKGDSEIFSLLGIVSLLLHLWVFIVAGFLRGTQGDNKYGPDPLAQDTAPVTSTGNQTHAAVVTPQPPHQVSLLATSAGNHACAANVSPTPSKPSDESASLVKLGLQYLYGEGVEKDMKQAAKWFQKAADKGNAEAKVRLEMAHWQMESAQAERKKEAFDRLLLMATEGNLMAQYFIGTQYAEGNGVPQSDKNAAHWWQLAAEQGDTEAQVWLANFGEGAADQGCMEAQYSLGMAYYNGDGMTKNYSKAAEWFWKAAVQGCVEAQYCLGKMFYNGDGMAKDDRTAVKWFWKAADQGSMEAQ